MTCEKEIEKAITLIKEKLPHFQWSSKKVIYLVKPQQVKIYNSSGEFAQDKLQIVDFDNKAE